MLKRIISIRLRVPLLLAGALFMALMASTAGYAETLNASPLGNADPCKVETAVGDLVADAMKSAMHTDAALIAASDLKQQNSPIPAGKVQAADVAALLSYPDDPIAVLTLNGSMLRQALERSVSIYSQRNQGFLQVSGIRFAFDPAGKQGERVKSLSIAGSPVQDSRTYSVAVPNSLADGALGYWKVWTKDNIRPDSKGPALASALESYFQASPKIDYRALNRITTTK